MSLDLAAALERIPYDPRWAPYSGWHDDHRHYDGTPAYLPAMQQVKGEFVEFLDVLAEANLLGGRCLQLGMGEIDCSHAVWRSFFEHVVTIDHRVIAIDGENHAGADTHASGAHACAELHGPYYDLLWIDAGHRFHDVARDHFLYGPMVRRGGIIAFHDALERKGYPEIGVPEYIATLPGAQIIGSEVGIAWIMQR